MNNYRLKMFKESIFLVGFMATGKSTLGRGLAQELDRPFVDLDEYLVEKENASIKEIFETNGEEYFREKELEYLFELTKTMKGIIALGGGTLQNQQVVDHVKLYGLLVYVKTPMPIIIDRVSRNKNRPIVLDKEGNLKEQETLFDELNALYSTRIQYYQQAQIHFDTSAYETKEDKVSGLIDKLKRYV